MTEEERLLAEQDAIMMNRQEGMEEDEAVKAQMDHVFNVNPEIPKLSTPAPEISDQDRVRELLAKSNPKKYGTTEDITENPDDMSPEQYNNLMNSPQDIETPQKDPNIPQVPQTPEQELAEARRQRNIRESLANMGKYISKAGSAYAGGSLVNLKNDTSFYDDMAKKAGRPVSELLADRKAKSDKEIQDMKNTILGDKVELSEKDSKIANTKRKVMQSKYGKQLGDIELDDLSVNQLKEVEGMLNTNEGKPLSLAQMMMIQQRKDNLQFRKDKQKYREEDKKNRELETDVQKFGKDAKNVQKVIGALGNVESKLGFKLDDIDVDIVNDTLKVKGKEKDLPGFSMPGLGRINLHNNQAQELESAMGKVFNTELKDRSGAAVTTFELEQLKGEFGKGKFNTESQMIQALKDYKRLAIIALRNREASYRKEVVDTYKKQGGVVVDNLEGRKPVKSGHTRMLLPNGKSAQVPNSEVEEAKSAGLKVME